MAMKAETALVLAKKEIDKKISEAEIKPIGLDSTLTDENKAAPAKITGDKIDELKSDLGNNRKRIKIDENELFYFSKGKPVLKHIDPNGLLSDNNNRNVCFEEPVFAMKGSTITVDSSLYQYGIALYNVNNGNFVLRSMGHRYGDIYTLDDDYLVRVEISDLSESVQSDTSIFEHLMCNLLASEKSKIRQIIDVKELNISSGSLSGNIGDTIESISDSAWNYSSFVVDYLHKYTISYYCTWTANTPHIYLCDESDKIIQIINGENANVRNTVDLVITNKLCYKVYVVSFNVKNTDKITVKDCGLYSDGIRSMEYKLGELIGESNIAITLNHGIGGDIGEKILTVEDNGWNYGIIDTKYSFKYVVTLGTAWNVKIPYIYLCDKNDIVLRTVKASTSLAKNTVEFFVDDESIEIAYIQTYKVATPNIEVKYCSCTSGMVYEMHKKDIEEINAYSNDTTAQLSNIVDSIGIDMFKNKRLTLASPYKYSAWPLLAKTGNKLFCLYGLADQHVPTSQVKHVIKISDNGVVWSKSEIIDYDFKGVTGIGNDDDDKILLWDRQTEAPCHTLYRTSDFKSFTKILTLPSEYGYMHISNVFKVDSLGLVCFWNTYGDTRSWGILKSLDNGDSWTRIVIESAIEPSECPVEICGVDLGNGKILAIGRKDVGEGTNAMFQIQSSDYGDTWTKEYTNITDIDSSTADILFDSNNAKINLYYFQRGVGVLRMRENSYSDIWNNPTSWNESTIIAHGSTSYLDSGQVKSIKFNESNISVFYAGSEHLTGIYEIIN